VVRLAVYPTTERKSSAPRKRPMSRQDGTPLTACH
jgi:hypothetical protein